MTAGPCLWHLISNRWNSAITEYALSAARSLQRQGYHCVLTPLTDSPAHRRAKAYGLPCQPVASFSWRALGRLHHLAKSLQPQATLLYGGPETFLTGLLTPSLGGCPQVRFRGQAMPTGRQALFLRLGHRRLASVLVAGQRLHQQLQAALPGQQVVYMPLGIDSEAFTFSPPAQQVRLHERPELLVVGRFDPVKGHAYLASIFARVVQLWQQARPDDAPPLLRFIGEAANISAPELEAAVRAEGLRLGSDVVLECRRVPKLSEEMNRATLGVVPSLGSEEICRVAEEFLLCGTPLLVSGVGALDDVLFAGAGESYRGCNDKLAIANQLFYLLQRSVAEGLDERRQRATTAYDHFSLEAMGRRLEQHLVEDLGVASPPRHA